MWSEKLPVTREEKGKFTALKNKDFTLTPVIDPSLLESTGMDVEFNLIFSSLGWGDA